MIRRRHLEQGHVERQRAIRKESGHVRQEDRGVIGPPVVDRGAHIGADEERVVTDLPGKVGGEVGRRSFRVQGNRFDPGEFVRPPHQRVLELEGRHRDFVEIDAVA